MKTRTKLFAGLLVVGLAALVATLRADNKKMSWGNNNPPDYCRMFLDTNLYVACGLTTSNQSLMGSVWTSTTAIQCPNAAGTPATLFSFTVPANMLLNVGDTIEVLSRGTMPAALAVTNQFQVTYGSVSPTTILDSGLQTASNSTYKIVTTLTKTTDILIQANARLDWGPGGGAPFAFTNVEMTVTGQTNSADNTFAILSCGRLAGSHTNTFITWRYIPAGRGCL